MNRFSPARRGRALLSVAAWVMAVLPHCAEARVTHLELTSSVAYEGASFGGVGRYEKLVGTAYGELDPLSPANRIIQDIDLAPRNVRGMVEYSTDVYLVRPIGGTGNRTLLVDTPNRGNKFSVYSFNHDVNVGGALSDPAGSLAAIGDGFLQRQGFSLLWLGWQGDLLEAPNRLRVHVPVATGRHGRQITGTVRGEYIVNAPTWTQNLSSGAFTGISHDSYPPVSLDTRRATLTRRHYEESPRELIDSDAWAFADCTSTTFPGTSSETQICLRDGFDPGYIYELMYTAHSPKVLGIGLAATRDVVSFLRYQGSDDAGNMNPLVGAVDHTIGYGLSQAARLLRTFVHLGFNADAEGRIVFDGVNAHIAPAHIPVNVRFGQPGRAYGQREEHTFPAAEGPFSWGLHESERLGFTDGMLRRCSRTQTCPKVIQTISSIEYWQGRMSLATARTDGRRDLDLPELVRLYHFAGTQHVPDGGQAVACEYPNNFNSYREGQRALLLAHQRWIADDMRPPENRYPLVADGSLVTPAILDEQWPEIPDVGPIPDVNGYQKLRFGPRFDEDDESGILHEPPKVGRREFQLLLPGVDADGNEFGGIRSTTLQVPLGTYAGWNARREGFGAGDLCGLSGSYFPFSERAADRVARNDPRLSVEERYGDHAGYAAAVKVAAQRLQADGFLLQEDADRLVAQAAASDILK